MSFRCCCETNHARQAGLCYDWDIGSMCLIESTAGAQGSLRINPDAFVFADMGKLATRALIARIDMTGMMGWPVGLQVSL